MQIDKNLFTQAVKKPTVLVQDVINCGFALLEVPFMAIEIIDPELCNGCGNCIKRCPADVIRMSKETKKAFIQYREDCILCLQCLLECSQNAILMSAERNSSLFTSWG